MKRIRYLVPILLFTMAAQSSALTTGVDFLKLGIGARAAGMGESFVALCPDVTAGFWNPAGLASIQKPELGVMHSDAIVDASLEFAGFAYPTRYGTVSIGSVFYIIKPVPVTLGDGQVLGNLNWTDAAISLAYGKQVTGRLSCGIGAKIIHRMESDPIFGSSQGTAYAWDAGILFRTPIEGLSAGAAILNTGNELQMSGEVKKDTLPQTMRAGLAYTHALDRHTSLITAVDAHRVLNDRWHLGGGLELGVHELVFLRSGYYEKEGNIRGATYGVGFRVKQFRIDYSNIPASEMVGYTRNNKISVIVEF